MRGKKIKREGKERLLAISTALAPTNFDATLLITDDKFTN